MLLEPSEPEREPTTGQLEGTPAPEEFEAVLGMRPAECTYTDAYRAIRTALLAASSREPFRRVLITSGQPGEGKSVVCLNLGSSLARVGKRVLVIDADFRRPTLGRMLNTPAGPGFMDACRGEVEPLAVIRSTNLEGLSVVAVGSNLTDAADVASSQRPSVVLDQMDEHYDFILIDSAPVLSYAASLQLATMADGVVFVARARGSVGYAQRALSALEEVGARILGVIVNDILPHDRAERAVAHHYYTPEADSQGPTGP